MYEHFWSNPEASARRWQLSVTAGVLAQIAKRRREHTEKNPDANIIPLGIGDTTEPLTPTIAKAMAEAAQAMGTREGYSGCAPAPLRAHYQVTEGSRCYQNPLFTAHNMISCCYR